MSQTTLAGSPWGRCAGGQAALRLIERMQLQLVVTAATHGAPAMCCWLITAFLPGTQLHLLVCTRHTECSQDSLQAENGLCRAMF